ncbi:MAG TPA: OmpA family protein [Pseudoduganella sp.]|jgi:outer membrane protein OmpA-like peptidoglycan-associated protein
MNQIPIRPLFALLCPLVTSGCTLLSSKLPQAPLAYRPAPAPHLVAQVGFGNAAQFGLCVPPACPVVTAKHQTPSDAHTAKRIGESPSTNARTAPSVPKSSASPIDVLSVYFDSGRSILNMEARRSIDSLVASSPVRHVRIAAHTDATGTPAQNGRLAEDRAAAVSSYIKAMPALAGVSVDVEAKAMCCYVATNANATGRRLNRRVDIALIDSAQEELP